VLFETSNTDSEKGMNRLDRYFSLRDKVVLVTGATKGIGRAMVDAFSQAGATLVVSSNEHDANVALASELKARGTEATALSCDVSRFEELESLVSGTLGQCGKIDVLVCNAGIPGPAGPMSAATEEDVDALFRINLHHPRLLSGIVAPHMANRGGGSIILTASIAGIRGNKNVGLYGLTKAALAQLARNLAVEWGPQNVRANAISPGLISTEWASAILSNADAASRRLELTPLRRIGEPWEIAATALFLASPGGGFITGQNIIVDGGTVISDGN
jgi:NAD(P)-dependent dehydrogenase (short-subunit alcohol dehydrogenase family)